MCLAVPMKVVERQGEWARVKSRGLFQQVSLQLVPEAKIGDYVLVHAGFAIQRIDEVSAKESLELWKQIEL